jgi:hypothetical protein
MAYWSKWSNLWLCFLSFFEWYSELCAYSYQEEDGGYVYADFSQQSLRIDYDELIEWLVKVNRKALEYRTHKYRVFLAKNSLLNSSFSNVALLLFHKYRVVIETFLDNLAHGYQLSFDFE